MAKFETEGGPPSDEQPTPAPASGPDKAKLAELETKEKQLKEILKNSADATLSKVLADTQSEMEAIRNRMQLAKDPAAIFEETNKAIQNMERERAALEKKFDKAREVLEKACSDWRGIGAKLKEKDEKIKQQKRRQQEALSRKPQQDASKVDVGMLQSACAAMVGMAKEAADHGVCNSQMLQQTELGLQQFSQLVQNLAFMHGQTQQRIQAAQQQSATPGVTSVAVLVEAHEAQIKQHQVAANIVQANRECLAHELQTVFGCPLSQTKQARQQAVQQQSLEQLGQQLLQKRQQDLENEQKAQELQRSQGAILQTQGDLQPLDAGAIARSSVVAMANAMGGLHQPQPDARHELWAEIPAGGEEEYDQDLDWNWNGGGAKAEARRQHLQQLQQAIPKQAQGSTEAAPMAVEPEQPKQQEEAAASTGPESPDRAAGSRTLEQKLAELDTMPNFESKQTRIRELVGPAGPPAREHLAHTVFCRCGLPWGSGRSQQGKFLYNLDQGSPAWGGGESGT